MWPLARVAKVAVILAARSALVVCAYKVELTLRYIGIDTLGVINKNRFLRFCQVLFNLRSSISVNVDKGGVCQVVSKVV